MINRNISVRAVIYKNKKIFVVRQKSLKTVTGVLDYYNMPGGKLEVNEGLKECLEREIIEELGVKPEIGDLLFIQQFSEVSKGECVEYLQLFFNITNPDDFDNIDLTQTTHGSSEIVEAIFVNLQRKILPKFIQTIDLDKTIAEGKLVYITIFHN